MEIVNKKEEKKEYDVKLRLTLCNTLYVEICTPYMNRGELRLAAFLLLSNKKQLITTHNQHIMPFLLYLTFVTPYINFVLLFFKLLSN